MRAGSRTVTPMSGVQNSWERSTTCKHFFPCNGLTGGNIVDVKGGVSSPAQVTKTFIYNSAESSVLSTDIGTTYPATLNGSWAALATGKAMLFMCAGYVDNTYTQDWQVRCALGDINNNLGNATSQGFGLADGNSGSGICQHVSLRGNSYETVTGSYSGCTNVEVGADATGVTLAQGSYFIRYAIYQPGVQIESKFLTSAGVVSINSATLRGPGGAVLDQGGLTLTNAFRMSGFRCTGIAVYHFNAATVPADYMTAVNFNGALWKTGKKEIYTGSGW